MSVPCLWGLVSVYLKYGGLISVIFHNFSNKFELEILSSQLKIDVSLRNKINSGQPVVAIETAILTHGMPIEPGNQFVKLAFNACKQHGVSPAFLSVVNGALRIGASEKELSALVNNPDSKKISRRNMGIALAMKWSGGTTVSAGIFMANQAGISVFCTGGIGGVHREFSKNFDISQDLFALSKTPVIVVSSGAKAVLDLTKTFEALEFFGIPVVGYRTDEFPSFWSRNSGLTLEVTANSPEEIVSIWKHHLSSGAGSALIVANPVPEKDQIPYPEIDGLIKSACVEADTLGISGPDLTPFLLKFLNDRTEGKCLKANISLAVNNLVLGAAVSNLI